MVDYTVNNIFYILFFLLSLISCNGSKYNYELVNDDGELLIKGNVTTELIPNGEFVFYDENTNIESTGMYENGIKKGRWKYFLRYFDKEINWKKYNAFSFEFPLSSDYNLSFVDTVFYAKRTIRESNKFNFFSIRKIPGFGIDNDFEKYCKSFISNLIKENNCRKVIDFTDEIVAFEAKNLRFLIFDCLDDIKGEYYFILFLVEESPGVLVEVDLLTMNTLIDSEVYFFKEVISDIYFEGKLLVGKRWGGLH